MGSRAGLNPIETRKIPCSNRESNPGHPARMQKSFEINHVRDLRKTLLDIQNSVQIGFV
jgi:hypothetical protein